MNLLEDNWCQLDPKLYLSEPCYQNMTSIANKAKAGILDVNQVNSFVDSCKDYLEWMRGDCPWMTNREARDMLDLDLGKNSAGDYCYQMQFENVSPMTKLLFEIQAEAANNESFIPSSEQCAKADCCVNYAAEILGYTDPSYRQPACLIRTCPESARSTCSVASKTYGRFPTERLAIVSKECYFAGETSVKFKNSSTLYDAAVDLCSSCSSQYTSLARASKQYSFSSGCNRTSEIYEWACQKSKEVNGEYCLADIFKFDSSETKKNLANSSYTLSEQDCLNISCCIYSYYKLASANLSRFDECKVPISKTCASLTYRIPNPSPTNSQNLASNSSDYTKWYAIGGGVGGSVIVLSAVFAIRSHRKKSGKNLNAHTSTYAVQLSQKNESKEAKQQFTTF
jgi:hypothetical protein